MSSLIFFATKSGSVGRPLRTAMSASRRRKSLTSFEATTSIVMPGSMRRSFAMTGGRMNAEYASLAVMHTRPSIDCDCPEAAGTHGSPHRPWREHARPVPDRFALTSNCVRHARTRSRPIRFRVRSLAGPMWLRHAQCPGRRRKRAFFCGHEESASAVPVKLYRSPIHAQMHINQANFVN